eukprot:11444577-Karenia_brevis.AAC.1
MGMFHRTSAPRPTFHGPVTTIGRIWNRNGSVFLNTSRVQNLRASRLCALCVTLLNQTIFNWIALMMTTDAKPKSAWHAMVNHVQWRSTFNVAAA